MRSNFSLQMQKVYRKNFALTTYFGSHQNREPLSGQPGLAGRPKGLRKFDSICCNFIR